MAVASSTLGVTVFIILNLSIPTGCLNSNQQVALFVFGDSLFDPGNNNHINTTTDFQANFVPYGQSYFNPPTGRFTDGRLIPDFIAEYAKLPLIPAYLHPLNKEYTHGANFASGGAGALIQSYAGFVVDLQTQLRHFEDLDNYYRQNLLGDNEARQLISSAVYLFSCGANDYMNFIDSYTYEQYVDMVVGNLTNAIMGYGYCPGYGLGEYGALQMGIYEKGGRKFGFMTVPLTGCWPVVRITQPGNTCSKEMDDMIRLHNQALAKRLENLEKQLEGFMYVKFDYATSLKNRMKDPSKYGFKEGHTACCGSGPFRGIYNCGGMRGIKEYELCDNVSEYLFFDSGHPSELANRQLAELFWNGDSKVTEPFNLKTLFEGKPSTTILSNDEL